MLDAEARAEALRRIHKVLPGRVEIDATGPTPLTGARHHQSRKTNRLQERRRQGAVIAQGCPGRPAR